MFEKILATNLINFLIVISTLCWIYKKARLGDLIQKMADDIKKDVEKSSANAQSAISEYKAVKKATKDTPKLKEDIISNAKNNAENIKEKIKQQTSNKKQEINNTLAGICQKQGEKIKKFTTSEAYKAVINLALDEVTKRLDENTHKKLINNAIDELSAIEGKLFWKTILI